MHQGRRTVPERALAEAAVRMARGPRAACPELRTVPSSGRSEAAVRKVLALAAEVDRRVPLVAAVRTAVLPAPRTVPEGKRPEEELRSLPLDPQAAVRAPVPAAPPAVRA